MQEQYPPLSTYHIHTNVHDTPFAFHNYNVKVSYDQRLNSKSTTKLAKPQK